MTRLAVFAAEDVDNMAVQASQRAQVMSGAWYEAAGPAWTVHDNDGRALCCAGFLPAGPSYMIAWSVLADAKGAAMVTITRAVRRIIAEGGWRRVELHTDARNDDAARWAQMLGFELESVKRCALADGGDMLVWARVRQIAAAGES